jgi:hypothetical protein
MRDKTDGHIRLGAGGTLLEQHLLGRFETRTLIRSERREAVASGVRFR